MRKLNIHILYEHSADLIPHGCSYIRNILPFTHPINANVFRVTQGIEYKPADVLIIERTWKPVITLEAFRQLVFRAKADGACLIYSIDDNLVDLDIIPISVRMAIRYICRHVDGIIVSTPFLKTRLEHLNSNIFVVKNALDERLFYSKDQNSAYKHPGSRITIGYMGTYTHDSDLMMVLQPLRAMLRKYHNKVQFQVVGGISDPDFIRYYENLPVWAKQVPVEHVEYPKFVKWMKKNVRWDLGIAPLEDNYFSLSKSDIKFLDYSALGIPGIYSRVPAYLNSIQHLETGCLVENTPDAWANSLERMILDDQLRENIMWAANKYVYAHRSLSNCAQHWQNAIQKIAKY